MPGTYVHLAGRDVDEPILKKHGLDKIIAVEEKFTVISCTFCKKITPAFEPACVYCEGAINPRT
ncbi:MAG: hypothetical protein LBE57_00030 [Methanosarcinales archaeon]|jgi:hypothetical protein|nr:hypothetical protein [Methanosarcinales archaeon]